MLFCVFSPHVEELLQAETAFQDAGEHLVKNISEPIRVFRLLMGDEVSGQRDSTGL